ncbi:outer membrane immunogenic protein [Rhodoblastus sphagnicola]|nr:outer membrane protein [Rhodoblastus sphagnicola]MBB4196317.1 outer membrane immunogenic protein [Rhodoblastus sphagnicola]
MRNILLSTVALSAMVGSALAADLPSSKAPPVYVAPAPIFSWTGLYIGVEGGGDFRQYKDRLGAVTIDKDAGLIGGVIGYNWQTGGYFGINNLVLGLEGDAAAVLGGSKAFTTNGNPIVNDTFNSNYAAAIRGRIGIPAWDRALLYVAGGVAFGDAKVRTTVGSVTNDRVGYTIGAGVDYAFTPNWIARLEYRYVDLGRENYTNVDFGGRDRLEVTSHQVLGALIYKFGAPETAVVAKY